MRNALSFSFGFGGSNCVLAFGSGRPAMSAQLSHESSWRASRSGRRACRAGMSLARSFAASRRRRRPPAPRPAPALLAPTERRRAPDTVAVALEVAARACAAAGRAPSELPSRVRLDAWRSRDQRLHVRDAVDDAGADLADQVSQFRAQRGGRLLEHRHWEPTRRTPRSVRSITRSAPACWRRHCRSLRAAAGAVRRVRYGSARARWPRWRRAAACSAWRSCSRRLQRRVQAVDV